MIFVSVRGEGAAWLCSHRCVFGGNGAMCVWNILYSYEIVLERKAAVDVSVAVALNNLRHSESVTSFLHQNLIHLY